MFGILITIFIVIAVYYRIQRARQEGGSPYDKNSLPNTTVTTPSANNTTRPPTQQTIRHQSAQAAIQEAREDGNSTTAYLMEKAEADAREHAKEKFEEQKRLYETRGGLAVAERYLEGDSIPQGKKCVSCGYCGAENLVPMIPRQKYSCYFCREPL